MAGHASWPDALGITRGTTVMLMADLTRIAWRAKRSGEEFQAAALLDTFRQAVGEDGTLLVPTYTFDLGDGDDFDRRSNSTISGALGTAALGHPAFRRTPHPLHSFAVAGTGREELMASTEPGSFGPGSPFAFLYRHHGLLAVLDLPVDRVFTFAHFVEEREGVSYRVRRPLTFRYTDLDGSTGDRTFTIQAKKPGHHMDFSPMEGALERAGALRRGVVDGVRWIVIDLHAAYPVIAEDLRRGGPESVHRFRWSWWLRDVLKAALRTFGLRTRKEGQVHARRSS